MADWAPDNRTLHSWSPSIFWSYISLTLMDSSQRPSLDQQEDRSWIGGGAKSPFSRRTGFQRIIIHNSEFWIWSRFSPFVFFIFYFDHLSFAGHQGTNRAIFRASKPPSQKETGHNLQKRLPDVRIQPAHMSGGKNQFHHWLCDTVKFWCSWGVELFPSKFWVIITFWN